MDERLASGEPDDDDFEVYGGPISPGTLMTLLRSCIQEDYLHLIPHAFDMAKMAREINGWLTLVGDTVETIAETRPKQ